MIDINDYDEEVTCCYKGESYRIRDNGAVMRLSEGRIKPRRLDNVWTFGTPGKNGYMTINAEAVHRIVATAFLGDAPTPQHIVDHIDTNRQNNRPENLRWLTKLENILLNPITKSKIEFLCGSIENFLKNPSLLKGYEYQDKNFKWMRSVSKEEAESTLKNWNKLIGSTNRQSSSNTIGEWIYENGNTNNVHANPVFEKLLFDKTVDYTQTDEYKREIRKKESIEKANTKKELKKQIRETILNVAKQKNWIINRNVDFDGLKVDYIISHGGKKILLQSLRTTRNIKKEYQSLINQGLKCYWLGVSDERFYDYEVIYPYFKLSCEKEECLVNICGDLWRPLDEFITLALEDSIIVEEKLLVKTLKIRFKKINCYRCGFLHYVYYVEGLYSEIDSHLSSSEGLHRSNIEIDSFSPVIIESLKNYLHGHPEVKMPMGEIKNRYSHTMSESYMSFGCPNCGSIIGDHYLQNSILTWGYEADDEYTFKVDLIEPGLIIPYKHWWVKNK